MRSPFLTLAACGFVAAGTSCGGSPVGPSASSGPATYLAMSGTLGDGGRFTQRAGLADATFSVRRELFGGIERVSIGITSMRSQTTVPAPETTWERAIIFTTAPGVPLGSGTFELIQTESNPGPANPTFWLGMWPESRAPSSCTASTTRWRIAEFSASRPDGIDRLLLNFEVRCDRGTGLVVGEVSLAGGTQHF